MLKYFYRFGAMTRVYYKSAIAAIVCFDISRPSTLDNVKKWRDDINDKVVLPNGQPIPMVLLATKCDLPEISIDHQKMNKFVKENNFILWYETSAKTNQNIEKAFNSLVEHIVTLSKSIELISPNANVGTTTQRSGLNIVTNDNEESKTIEQRQLSSTSGTCCT